MYWSIHRFGRKSAGLLIVVAVVVVLAVFAARGPNSAEAMSPNASVFSSWAMSLDGVFQEQPAEAAAFMGVDACTECHTSDGTAWEASVHGNGYKNLHKRLEDADGVPKAKQIATALELKRSVRGMDRCATCHYTRVAGKTRASSGVSCESCHGAAGAWITPHSTQAKDAKKRETNLQACEEMGMMRPTNVYGIAQNCFTCHTVPDEELVNIGGHPTGNLDFELVAWSQGEVRHNYQHSPDGKNREATAERKRILYVVGALTDYEYSLRALERAKVLDGEYAKAMEERVARARKRLEEIQKKYPIDEVRQALTPDAANVSAAAKAFVNNHDGKGLAALDDLIPGPDKYRGKVHP